jgi:hypothetical protein
VQGKGDQGQPLYQVFHITVDPNQPLTVVLPASGSTLFPGTVGQAFGINFFLSGGAVPYTWAFVAGQLPPGMHLQTFSDPRDADNEMTGTPTKAGTFTWTMRVTGYNGQQATQQFTRRPAPHARAGRQREYPVSVPVPVDLCSSGGRKPPQRPEASTGPVISLCPGPAASAGCGSPRSSFTPPRRARRAGR